MAQKRPFALLGWIFLFLFVGLTLIAGAGHYFADEICMTECQDALVAPAKPNIPSQILHDISQWYLTGSCLFWCSIT